MKKYTTIILILTTLFCIYAIVVGWNMKHSNKCLKTKTKQFKGQELDSFCSIDMGASFETRVKKYKYLENL